LEAHPVAALAVGDRVSLLDQGGQDAVGAGLGHPRVLGDLLQGTVREFGASDRLKHTQRLGDRIHRLLAIH
jgi:hypothetical protein